MQKSLLKGNFTPKKSVTDIEKDDTELEGSQKIANELKAAVMKSLGGSMVYVERTDLEWDGNEE